MAILRVGAFFLVCLLLFASPFLQEEGELGIVGDGVQEFVDAVLGPAAGVDTICFFPKNSDKLVPAGGETEILVGVSNEGESSLKVISIKASLHLPFDHKLLVQNLTIQKTKRTKKVEVGTKNADTTNEWLQGTAFTQNLSKSISQSHKSKKKK